MLSFIRPDFEVVIEGRIF